jgi:hypothetical protein
MSKVTAADLDRGIVDGGSEVPDIRQRLDVVPSLQSNCLRESRALDLRIVDIISETLHLI